VTAIAGLWRLDGRPDAELQCARMLEALRMYGRDGLGTWADGEIALGRQLMRILPEDAFDRQPLHGGGDSVLVADVRLDNRDELAAALGIPRERLRALSDAAVLLAAYERWELDCFDRLVGDYALAIWDGARRRLLLARDPLAMRPLYYHHGKSLFAFASMPKGLHALPEVPRAANEERVAEFLVLMPDHGSTTFFQDVEKVEPGCFVVITPTNVTVRRHWEPTRRLLQLGSPDAYAEALRKRLDEAVRCRLRGVTEVGAQLSSGYDSSAVAATAARLLAPAGGRVHAFTSVPRQGYRDAGPATRLLDEGPLATATAAMYPNMNHVLIRAGHRSPLQSLDRNFLLYEQPVLNLCNLVWLDAIHDAARDRDSRVMLIGSMGNASTSYAGWERLPELVRSGRIAPWLREARALTAGTTPWRTVLSRSVGPWLPDHVQSWARRFRGLPAPDVLTYSALRPERLDVGLRARAEARELNFTYGPRRNGFAARLWLIGRGDARSAYNKGVLAEWGIDIRDPLSDRRLFEFCLAVPMEQFLRDGQPRALARRALADRLPTEVLDAPWKGYQAADWHEGLTAGREEVAEEVRRLSACPPAARVLAIERMRQLVEDWPASGWDRPEIFESYRWALLRGISAGHFLRRASEAPI
jgi:asparagine synthase (glutamine-hydrolysing)